MAEDKHTSAYKQAGVDLKAAEETVSRISEVVDATRIPGVISGLGGFGGLFSLAEAGLCSDDLVLVAGTDGVGTKLEIAFQMGIHDSIGVDCVAMCVNDVAVTGARPLIFLDYFATGRLNPEQAEEVIRGVAQGCKQAGCALVGGETAEMPGFYQAGEYEIAGFCVGAAPRSELMQISRVKRGQRLVGVSSSGLHSNGFSLVRRVIADAGIDLRESFGDELGDERPLGEVLLEPTAIYPKLIAALRDTADVTGLAHITGGGLLENVPRCLPSGLGARIDVDAWSEPAVFRFLRRRAKISQEAMFGIFNMGLGLVGAVDGDPAPLIDRAESFGFQAHVIGEIVDEPGVHLEGLGRGL